MKNAIKLKSNHLLWALVLLHTYKYESELARDSDGLDGTVDEKTFHKWAWLLIEAIAILECKVVVQENQHANDILNDALASVDGTDTPFQISSPPGRAGTVTNMLGQDEVGGGALYWEQFNCLDSWMISMWVME